jgi:ribosomal protein S27AE
MWLTDDDNTADNARKTVEECPGCGAEDLAGDDFCHECGHSFEHLRAHNGDDDSDPDLEGEPCPMCTSGTVMTLDHGRAQCDACGYMPRDEW